MTYVCNTTFTEYQFSAFAEADLSNDNLVVGSSFTMPASATVEFTVRDNDSKLSGDKRWNNDNAADWTGQTAQITQDGAEIGNGNQIYAEKYFWAKGNDGNWYLLIEIEQEGSNNDYFTFHNYYGTPPAGTTLSLACSGNIGCWQPDYACLTAGDIAPPAMLSGSIFEDLNGNDINDGDLAVEDVTVTLTNVDTGEEFTTTTLADGSYTFTDIVAGNYTVSFAAPEGKGFVSQDVGGDDTVDSDVDVNGLTAVISISAGNVITDVDAGIRTCGLIEGTSSSNGVGTDLLVGCDTDDTIDGFSGDDTLEGRGGDDEINASRGNDILVGGAGNDTLNGGRETDVAVFSGNAADYTIALTNFDGSTVTVTGPDGADALIDIEILRFDDGDLLVSDFISSAKEDVVAAPAALGGSVTTNVLANDINALTNIAPVITSVTNGAFGTTIVNADDTITYTAGASFTAVDVVSYTVIYSNGVISTSELVIGDISRPDAGTPGAILLSDSGETVLGSFGDDIFVGGAGDDNINARGGNDQMSGQGGNDTITGSAGSDLIDGGAGDDDLKGNPGNGNDTLIGGAGNDTMSSGGLNNIFFGDDGDDFITSNGNDLAYGGNGDDVISLGAGDQLVFGGAGADNILKIGEGADVIYAGDGNDTMTWKAAQADAARDLIDGQAGVDTLNLTVDAADAVAMQAEVDAYIAMVDAISTSPQDTNGVNVSYSFTNIELDIANIEAINLSVA